MKRNKLFTILAICLIVAGLLIIFNAPKLFTTTYVIAGTNPPKIPDECRQIGGIQIPKQYDCPNYFIEFGNSGTEAICCVQDTCQGSWHRVYNSSTGIFEKTCEPQ